MSNLNKIKVIKTQEIANNLGNIIKYFDNKNKFFKGFGEVYFSEIKKNKVKGWNLHKKFQSVVMVVNGHVRFTFMSYEEKKKKKITLSRANPKIIIIPNNVWYKFTSITRLSTIACLINKKHNPNETRKKNLTEN